MKIAYAGREDFRVLASEDLKRHSGVEGFRRTEFARGEVVEVSDEVGQALIDAPNIYGKFQGIESKQEELDFTEENEELKSSSKQTPSNEGSASTGSSTTGTSGSTRSGGTTGSGTTSGSTARSSKG